MQKSIETKLSILQGQFFPYTIVHVLLYKISHTIEFKFPPFTVTDSFQFAFYTEFYMNIMLQSVEYPPIKSQHNLKNAFKRRDFIILSSQTRWKKKKSYISPSDNVVRTWLFVFPNYPTLFLRKCSMLKDQWPDTCNRRLTVQYLVN